ncbi:MAG: leucyl aminopeptidase family protein [Proteobacteria bacterium]|nr:leucyl aminopeptidase family protein [Pseudomonadota bacterium]
MFDHLIDAAQDTAPEIVALAQDALGQDALDGWLAGQSPAAAAWVGANGFDAKPGARCLVPGPDGGIECVLLGVPPHRDPWAFAELPTALPAGEYRLADGLDGRAVNDAVLGWALGGYRFTRYRAAEKPLARLAWPAACDRAGVENLAAAIFLVRDLINTPAEDMGPDALAGAAAELAKAHGGECAVIVGDGLIAANYPAVHAVGRAAARAPRMIDLSWGDADDPKVTLVGKGVCFDSGGLDLKSASGMQLMKKDMGGAAHVLGLARAIMGAGLPVSLRVLVPAVENSVAGNALRPLDVIRTRKGITVEVGNTDAEGRLILADALAEADSGRPDLLIDCATLTGAARVALGPDVPALFTPDDALAADLIRNAAAECDPVWRLPLWAPYRELLDSEVADINNVAESALAGAVVAALFLKEFVTETPAWAHLDMMAWNLKARPGRPVGGEAMALRALYALIRERFGG